MFRKPNVLDLFCGAGGMSLGFQQAGCNILGGIDNNPHAIKTHHHNFSKCKLVLDAIDINRVNPQDLLIEKDEVDILLGGPPCQVYSQVGIGKMKSLGRDIEKDPRNFLYRNYLRFLHYFTPSFFVMENVNTLASKEIFKKILRELEKGIPRKRKNYPGYKIKYQILTASDYGVPQVRNRLFIVGVRKDLDITFNFPKPYSQRIVTIEEAISDLIPLTPQPVPIRPRYQNYTSALKTRFYANKKIDTPQPYLSKPKSSYQQKMREVISRKPEVDSVLNHICRSHNPQDIICFSLLRQGGKYTDLPQSLRRYRWDIFDDKYKRLPLNKPAWTLTAHMRKDGLAYIHPTQNRSISVREAARLQSFPDHFVFNVPMTRMFELVGNSVPPLLAEAIAEPLVKLFHDYCKNAL